MLQSQRSNQTAQGLRTVNPGDIIQPNQTFEEKSQQIAVDTAGIMGDRIVVPTYFVVDYPNGEKKALHHVRDAQEISDVIRQMRLYEETDDSKFGTYHYPTMLSGLQTMVGVLMVLFTMFTGVIVIGVL